MQVFAPAGGETLTSPLGCGLVVPTLFTLAQRPQKANGQTAKQRQLPTDLSVKDAVVDDQDRAGDQGEQGSHKLGGVCE